MGVALVVDPPVADEIDGLRRALADPALGRIDPHVTLVPPVNVRGGDLDRALRLLRGAAAARTGPLRLTLGPPASFLPRNPVLFLEVAGDGAELRALRDAVFAPPLARELTWPWVPHLTLADGVDPARITAALVALDRYVGVIEVDRVVLLEETRSGTGGRRWAPLADAALGPAAVVGRGGLALTLVRSRLVDPEAAELVRGVLGADDASWPWADAPRQVVVTARRDDSPAGVAVAWGDDHGGHVAVLVGAGTRHEGVGSHLLAHVEAAVTDAGWGFPALAALGPAGFYRARSVWSVPTSGARSRGEPGGYSKATEAY